MPFYKLVRWDYNLCRGKRSKFTHEESIEDADNAIEYANEED